MKSKIFIPIIFVSVLLMIFVFSGEEDETITVIKNEEQQTIDSEFIYNHPEAMNFPAIVRSSGKKPVETEYKGIELTELFASLNMDISNIKKITFNASDGYRIVMKIDEINEPKNVYLTFKRDGKLMKSKKNGGNGPYQLIIRRDPFSQRWIKHVEEIILE